MAENEKKMETVQRLLLAQIAEIRNDLPNFIDSIMQTITEPCPRGTNLLYILIDICNVLSTYAIGDRKYRPPSIPSFMKKNTRLRPQLIQAETEILHSFEEEITPPSPAFNPAAVIGNAEDNNNNNNNNAVSTHHSHPVPTPISIVQIPTPIVISSPLSVSSSSSSSSSSSDYNTEQTPPLEGRLDTQNETTTQNQSTSSTTTNHNNNPVNSDNSESDNNHTPPTTATTSNTPEDIHPVIQQIAKPIPIPISIEYISPAKVATNQANQPTQNSEKAKTTNHPEPTPSQKIYTQMSDLQLVQMYTFCLRLHEKLWEVLARLGNMAESVQANRSLKNLADSAKLLVEVKHIFRDRPKTLDLL